MGNPNCHQKVGDKPPSPQGTGGREVTLNVINGIEVSDPVQNNGKEVLFISACLSENFGRYFRG